MNIFCNGLKLAFSYIPASLHCILREEMFIKMHCPSQMNTKCVLYKIDELITNTAIKAKIFDQLRA